MKLKQKLARYAVLKRIVVILFSKSFISSLIFASALWAYASLNQEYHTNINIPLQISLPENRAFAFPAPEYLTLTVKGTGWQIFNLFFNSTAICNIDLTKTSIKDSVFAINRDNILKSIQSLNFVQPLEIIPDNFMINTGAVGEYSVPLSSRITIIPREGYTLVGDVQIKPDLVMIKGNDAIARSIQKWETIEDFYEDVYSPISTLIELSDSLKGVISVKPSTVKITADIQQIAEMQIPDVKVMIRGYNYMKNHIIEPLLLTVTVRGGVNVIKNLSPESVSAFIEYQKVLTDSSGVIVPTIQVPDNVTVLSVSPPYLFHKVRM